MNFDLTKASDKLVGSGKVYQKPGIFDNVVIETVAAVTNGNGKDYIQMTTVGETGAAGRSPQMYITEAAWPMTARNLTDLIIATNNVTEDEAKAMIKVETKEQLAAKLSAVLVGRKFRAKFKGEQSAQGVVFAQLGGSESMKVPAEDTKLFFNELKDIKKYEGTVQVKQPSMSTSDASSDLPF